MKPEDIFRLIDDVTRSYDDDRKEDLFKRGCYNIGKLINSFTKLNYTYHHYEVESECGKKLNGIQYNQNFYTDMELYEFNDNPITVSEFLKLLKSVVGKTIQYYDAEYNGKLFICEKKTLLWLRKPEDTFVLGVKLNSNDKKVIIGGQKYGKL